MCCESSIYLPVQIPKRVEHLKSKWNRNMPRLFPNCESKGTTQHHVTSQASDVCTDDVRYLPNEASRISDFFFFLRADFRPATRLLFMQFENCCSMRKNAHHRISRLRLVINMCQMCFGLCVVYQVHKKYRKTSTTTKPPAKNARFILSFLRPLESWTWGKHIQVSSTSLLFTPPSTRAKPTEVNDRKQYNDATQRGSREII